MVRLILISVLTIVHLTGISRDGFYNVLDYGAVNDGKVLSTGTIQKAIEECAGNGGGTVYFPSGRYLSGTLFLKSFVTLFFDAGAVLEGSMKLDDYPVTLSKIRSYTDNYTCRSLIYGENLRDIAIKGQGVIDGKGSTFQVTDEFARNSLFDSYKARPYMIRIINCTNVVVKDITIIDSPMWVQHYMACTNVNIEGITVNSRVNRNNDGIDIDACDHVRISDCNIISGDDAIVLKSTFDRPCRNVTVTNCILSSDCNAFKLGTESNGGFKNILLNNCVIYNTRLAGIALEMVDGGILENISVSGVNMDSVGCAIFVRLGNRARPFKANTEKPGMGQLFNVMLSNIQATNTGITGCSITGLPGYPVYGITLDNIRLSFSGGGTKEMAGRQIEEFPEKYPEFKMFGDLPAYGFFCRHVDGLVMENIELSCESPDYRPAICLYDVRDSRFADLKADSEAETESLIIVDDSQDLIIRDCGLLKKAVTLATIRNRSSNIAFVHNVLSGQAELYRADSTIVKSGIVVK